ncbi:MAG TPA: bifunctional oligoribonuclease/PAP phosphatase NrnA [Anaerolineae bacterium]|nr:bifunctional oligoribonuclease/PAP phosphatase NrnA [Anaerolineae bacterium]
MDAPTSELSTLVQRLRQAPRILLITHVSPDSDAIGSALGMAHALKLLGSATRVTPSCADSIRDRFDILPGHAEMVTQADGEFDLVVALDCGDESRLGSVWADLPDPRPFLINVDHHISNTRFGQINWIDPSAASTAEMVLQIVDELDVPLTQDIAICLLYGIVGDTLGFRTPNTTPRQLQYAERCMAAGASLYESIDQQFNQRSQALVCLWGKAINALKIKDRIVSTAISKEMRDACGMGLSDLNLSSFLVSMNEVDRAVVLVEKDDGQVEISLRAKRGFNVSKAAVALGGGGHPLAAGATIAGPLDAATKQVLLALKQNT